MKVLRMLGAAVLATSLLSAQIPEDPVLKAHGEKALTQGVSNGDLPPVPRGVSEPPPLPPPESNPKDVKGYRASRRQAVAAKRRGKGKLKAKVAKKGRASRESRAENASTAKAVGGKAKHARASKKSAPSKKARRKK
ncbi:MAG TPA: hypothetical protein PKL14_07280 [Holophaga sp.]|nr:hypothetical protein [Holophaga sp.]